LFIHDSPDFTVSQFDGGFSEQFMSKKDMPQTNGMVIDGARIFHSAFMTQPKTAPQSRQP